MKTLAAILIVYAGLMPIFAMADYRVPAGSPINGPVTFVFEQTPADYGFDDLPYYQIGIAGLFGPVRERIDNDTPLNIAEVFYLPAGTYNDGPIVYSCEISDCSDRVESGSPYFDTPFTVLPSGFFSLPTSTALGIVEKVTDQFGDAGTLAILAMSGGLVLAFYVFAQIIGLIPGNNKENDGSGKRGRKKVREYPKDYK